MNKEKITNIEDSIYNLWKEHYFNRALIKTIYISLVLLFILSFSQPRYSVIKDALPNPVK